MVIDKVLVICLIHNKALKAFYVLSLYMSKTGKPYSVEKKNPYYSKHVVKTMSVNNLLQDIDLTLSVSELMIWQLL